MNVWERIIIAAGALFTIMVIGILFFVEDIPVPVKSEEELARERFEAKKAAELEKLIGVSEALLPQISEDMGADSNSPINLKVINKVQAQEVNKVFLENTFPQGELDIINEALTFVGLLDTDFDISQQVIDLNLSQRSIFYDPSHGVTYAVIDAPEHLKTPEAKNDALVQSISHALQDRNLNINNNILDCKTNLDNIFAFEAMISGQTQLVAAATSQGLKPEAYVGDLGEELRTHYRETASDPVYEVYNGLPLYLRARQMAAKASGSSFVQAYLKANPEGKMAGLWDTMPVSSEQILHYEKFAENDMPKVIDISGIRELLPEEFQLFYTTTMGELDVRLLTSRFEATKETANEIAAGWDGINYAIYKTEEKTILVGTSVWDSNNDALEFSNAMKLILREKFGNGKYLTKKRRDKLSFIAGDIEGMNGTQLLIKLESSPFDEAKVEITENN